MDRVACQWLILRRIDPHAEFLFVPFGKDDAVLPEGAIPFALPGVELGAHDAAGSTFRKLMVKYGLADPALERMAAIIESGITHVLSQLRPGHPDVAALPCPEGIGLDAISQGMMMIAADDRDNIARSLVLYDALYAYCRILVLHKSNTEINAIEHPRRWVVMRDELAGLRG
jgi:hypothetical protein